MSIQFSILAWKHSRHSGTALLVLLALADHANEAGICWPGVQRIATMCRVSKRRVQQNLRDLENSGEIARTLGSGRTTSKYQITIRPSATEEVKGAAPAKPSASTGEACVTGALNATAPKSSDNHSQPPGMALTKAQQMAQVPSLNEWMDYAQQIGWATTDATRTYDHFTAYGWVSTRNRPVVDWQALARSCMQRARISSTSSASTKTITLN